MDDIEFASYADDNMSFTIGSNMEDVIFKLQNSSKILYQWFMDNQTKVNPEKCHFICSTNDTVSLIVEDRVINNSKCEKLLGVKFNHKLTFNTHIGDIYKKAGLKLTALSRIAPYMDFNKKRLLVNAFFISQFNYCPLIWMCHNHTKNNKINRIHERCLSLIYNDKKSSFENLLDKDKSVSIHDKNLKSLAIEICKVHRDISPEILNNLFPLRQADNII